MSTRWLLLQSSLQCLSRGKDKGSAGEAGAGEGWADMEGWTPRAVI